MAWHATATAEGTDAYREHFTRTVLPDLHRIDGYQGTYLLRRDHDTVVVDTVGANARTSR